MSPNFALCAEIWNNATPGTYDNYTYNGPVRGIFTNPSARPQLITTRGCHDLCGSGNEYYPWSQQSATISTWILPIIGLLLQAPYDSNAFWMTIYATARWVGSPIASISYVLWNIKTTGKCSLFVDMAVPYNEVPDEDSQFAEIRDSFYILGVMNQFSIKRRMPPIEAEKLLRIALFSDSLRLEAVEDETSSLVKKRRKLAKQLREGRKLGIVPVFISTMWFLFSLATSLQSAFGQLGDNATAHDLALGLLLSWLPVLIMCCIIDRNPVSTTSVRLKLNRLLDSVRRALLNPELRDSYIREIGREREDWSWTKALDNEEYFQEDFFTQFAGQGRIRWHYGVAHPIIAGAEESWIAEHGRDWLRDHFAARTSLVKGPALMKGLKWFDFRELWQMTGAILIVVGSAAGAFIISYFTPTVGLGCRSGGYMVFTVIAIGLLTIEMLIWWLVPEHASSTDDVVTRIGTKLHHTATQKGSILYHQGFREKVHKSLSWWTRLSIRDRLEYCLLRPIEYFNCAWLCYIIAAQTFGSYQNCDCMSSLWAPGGGYLDFEDFNYYRSNGVTLYWGLGTATSMSVMAFSFAFIIWEWCTQSHLCSSNYKKAASGLKTTRRFKKYTYHIRNFADTTIELVKLLFRGRRHDHDLRGRRSVLWTSKTHSQKRKLWETHRSHDGSPWRKPDSIYKERGIFFQEEGKLRHSPNIPLQLYSPLPGSLWSPGSDAEDVNLIQQGFGTYSPPR